MGSQTLNKKTGQLILTEQKCGHGVLKDARGNTGCEECYENRCTSSYLLGIAVGFEQASADLLGRAGKAFSAGRDTEANMYRELSKELDKVAEERREDQKKHDREYGDDPSPSEDPFTEADESAKY
jgi:hypothetical protein